MKFLTALLQGITPETTHKRKVLADNKQEALVKLGREQFKKLLEKGLTVPVALL